MKDPFAALPVRAATAFAALALALASLGCPRIPPMPPESFPADSAFVAGIVAHRTTDVRKLRARLFATPAALPGIWPALDEETLLHAVLPPGRVLLGFGAVLPEVGRLEIAGALPIELPGPGCYWFGGVAVRREAGVLAFERFATSPRALLDELFSKKPEVSRCARALVPVEVAVEDAVLPLERGY